MPHQQPDRLARPAHRPDAAILSASASLLAPASRYGPAPSMLRPAAQPATLAPWRSDPSGRGPLRPRASFWSAELGLGRPVAARLDHVQHHLHAGTDALDEVRLGDEVGASAEIERVAAGGRRRGRRREQQHGQHEQAGQEPARDARGSGAHRPTIRRNAQGGSPTVIPRRGSGPASGPPRPTAIPFRCA